MADLKTQIEESASKLAQYWTAVQAPTGNILPLMCYEHWAEKASLHQILMATAHLFPVREKAWEVVNAVAKGANVKDIGRNLITYGGLEMDFPVARHLALTSYVAVTWSIYDRLANICGRLASMPELAKNPKQNPKVCENFLDDKKEPFGFAVHLHLQQAYKWPLKVTYKVRNWLVHEGYEEGSTRMFFSDRIEDGLRLHDDAVNQLERMCSFAEDENGDSKCCCLKGEDNPWRRGQDKDLLIILEKY